MTRVIRRRFGADFRCELSNGSGSRRISEYFRSTIIPFVGTTDAMRLIRIPVGPLLPPCVENQHIGPRQGSR
jgi:hypothetical protein